MAYLMDSRTLQAKKRNQEQHAEPQIHSTAFGNLKAERPRLVVVSNREPYAIKMEEGSYRVEKTQGGLVTAFDPVLRENGGLWVCWRGSSPSPSDEMAKNKENIDAWLELHPDALPYALQTVELSDQEIQHYYHGFANARLWPLFHYLPNFCDFSEVKDWSYYLTANHKFAEAVVDVTSDQDFIWVQDYQLFLVPYFIRRKASSRKIGFFCHIPFPDYEIFRILPMRKEILMGMLGADCIGFHTPDYVIHFLECVQRIIPDAKVDMEGAIEWDGRRIRVIDCPISIDYQLITNLAQSKDVIYRAEQLRSSFQCEFIGIGVDRLDYTKGILERLESLRVFFREYPEYCGRMSFIQVAAPTRTEVESYQNLRQEVEQTVGRINGELAREGWTPIQYYFRGLSHEELLPYFLISDFALITPLRDGMNLVAKEYCAAKAHDGRGALILSEFTGAAYQLHDAFIVNPYSFEEVAGTIHHVLNAPSEELQGRMSNLAESIAEQDIHHWVRQFLKAFEYAVSRRYRKTA